MDPDIRRQRINVVAFVRTVPVMLALLATIADISQMLHRTDYRGEPIAGAVAVGAAAGYVLTRSRRSPAPAGTI